MKNIQAVRIGNVVNVSIDGKLQKKNCGSPEEANDLFKAILKAKENGSDANIKALRCLLSEKLRIAYLAGLETDPETNEVFLAGFNTPVPATLIEVFKEYNENGYPVDAIINFWKLLMINPDVKVRESLFSFITTHDFVLTDAGYMLVYKAVDRIEGKKNPFAEFVSNRYLHVRKTWKESAKSYVVYKDSVGEFNITKLKTAEGWKSTKYGNEKNVEVLGNLNDLYESMFDGSEENDAPVVYESMYSGAPKMIIELGKPVKQERKACDANPSQDCSNGLHVGATKYVETFGSGSNKAVLVCLVNPANVVAVPDYDHSKMRVCEYFPFAVATYVDGKIDIVEQAYYEDDYKTYEEAELEEQIALVKANELPIATAQNAEKEVRPMSELMKMLESRLVDIE